VQLDGQPITIVGVMPPDFRFPQRSVQAWMPLVFREENYEDRTDSYINVVARMKRGVAIERARSQVETIGDRLAVYPENENTSIALHRMGDEIGERSRMLVLALCGAAFCVLLLACANLGSLLLARSAYRERELAVRAALGAGRERIVRQLLTESALLAGIGGALGVAFAAAALPLLARLVPASLPIAERPAIDGRVLAVAMVMMVGTALLLGAAPAVRVGRGSALDALRGGARAGGGRTRRLRAALVVAEVAASVVLLVSSGLLMRALWRIESTDPGFDATRVLAVRTALPLPQYDSTDRRVRFYDRLLGQVRAIPGVQ